MLSSSSSLNCCCSARMLVESNCYLDDADTVCTFHPPNQKKKKKKKKKKEEQKLDQHQLLQGTFSSKGYLRKALIETNPNSPGPKLKLSLWRYNWCIQEGSKRTGTKKLIAEEESVPEGEGREQGECLAGKKSNNAGHEDRGGQAVLSHVGNSRSQSQQHTGKKGYNTGHEDQGGEAVLSHVGKSRSQLQQHTGVSHRFVALLKICAEQKDLERGSQVHANIIGMGWLEKDKFVGNSLLSMYAKCGSLARAQTVFNWLPVRSVVSWSALISGYAQQGHGELALKCFEQMQLEGLSPDAVAFVSALKACAGIGAAEKGKEIHADIFKEGLLGKNIFVGTALVDMYARCGLLVKAQEVFDNLPDHNLITWNALITGYVQHGYGEQVLQCFETMQREGLSADVVTFICILKASGIAGAAEKGKEVHAEIVKKSLLETHVVVGTALVDMYAKCSLLAEAQEVFEKLSVRDVVSWSALIAGYAEHRQAEQAMEYFERMQLEGPPANAFTFACILKACGSIGAADKGRQIHADIVREGLLEKCFIVGTALVDMYGKCGLLADAQEVFDQLPNRDVVAWSVLIDGYTLLGKDELVFSSFNRMVEEGIKPNLVTFTSVLNACCHAGLVDKGQKYFDTMGTGYGLIPTLEHHTCMVDLFARAGHLDRAITILKDMPYCADLTIWLTMLGACHKWGNMKLGRLAFEHVIQLNEKEVAAYICMRNIYADAGRQEDADKVEAMRVEKQAC